MSIHNKVSRIVLALTFALGLVSPMAASAALTPGFLGALESFSVFGAAGITGGAASTVWGDVGENAFGDGSISGNQAGTYYPAASTTLVSARTSAYGDLFAETPTGTVDLSTVTSVGPGVYTVTSSGFSQTLTLTGAGTYVFQRASDIAQTAGGTMILAGGACASDVYWQTSTGMTFAAAGNIEGTIIAETAITFANPALTFKGRALSDTAVALGGITITEPVTCAAPVTPTPQPRRENPAPLISVTKIPTPLALPLGPESVTYNYEVSNIGPVAMDNVTVTDNFCPVVGFISGDTDNDLVLDTTETWKYSCTIQLSTTTTNTVIAAGSANGFTAVDTAEATVVVGLPVVPPLIRVVKVPNTFLLSALGGPVTYTYTVTNPGTEPLHNVSITDNKCTGLPGQVFGHPGDLNQNGLLESNETWIFTCQTNITQTTTNTATARGSANGFTAIDYAFATVVVSAPLLPNTGLTPFGESITVDIIVGLVILAIASYMFMKRRKADVV